MASENLKSRIGTSRHQQYRPKRLRRLEDPITGRIVLLNPNRMLRHAELASPPKVIRKTRNDCYYCKGETTSTLFYVDDSMRVNIPDETESLDASRAFLKMGASREMETYYNMVKSISRYTLPPKRWLTRTFLNLIPPMTDYPETSFVTAVSPEHHYREMHELPLQVLSANIVSWQTIEKLSSGRDLETVPFINGGRRPESGQSIFCFHSQIYLIRTPPLYKRIARRRNRDGCGVCELLKKRGLTVYSNKAFRVLAHPAPVRNHSLLIAPVDCIARLSDMEPDSFADALKTSLEATRLLTGSVPAYNVALRCGKSVGHLHAEFVPKTETNVPAGFEETTDMVIVTEPPIKVSALLKRLLS